MKPYRNQGVFRKIIFLSICIFAGAVPRSFAQNTGSATPPEQIQQQIEQLQQLLELQRQAQQLQQQPVQYAPQTPRGPVTLQPVDTGRSAVTFNLGGDEYPDRFAIKTNLLYAGATLTPNLAFEFGLGRHTSIDVSAGYNGWTNLWDNAKTGPDRDPNNHYKRRLDHIFGKAEFRYWFRERFRSHFLGANVFYADYNVGELKVPLLFEKEFEYDGNAYGGGFSYGYLWRWSKHWAMEFSLGIGVVVMKYSKSFIETGIEGFTLVDPNPYRKTYFGPTNVGIKLVFTIK